MTTSTASPLTRPEGLLRLALRLDAAVSALNGVAYVVVAAPLGDLLGLSAGLLRGLGVFLLLYAAAVWWVGARPAVDTSAVRAVIAANLLWTAGSIGVAVTGLGSPTTVGTVWIVLQAVAVAGFAALQAAGLRRVVP